MSHEMSVAESIAVTVLRSARAQSATKVEQISLEIGELTFLNPEQVTFWLRELFKDSEARDAEIEWKTVPAKVRCKSCGYEGPLEVKDDPLLHTSLPVFACPRCGKGGLEIVEGKDYVIRSIEIVKES